MFSHGGGIAENGVARRNRTAGTGGSGIDGGLDRGDVGARAAG
ncbi:hypothetical protein B005_4478 [Nocardiopsis alba ATCC BAA-2165]|uniref:Uncharacterized protein n=1 Tax=Nocardiopsis alba (strain ATCC BAA-2165 / BE74) TaxID=1205910 RepID=J7L3M3_NOCAA|nr:hypothetical protein B005_4478 [Nocardiopsis alba ATCC BAA-2165]